MTEFPCCYDPNLFAVWNGAAPKFRRLWSGRFLTHLDEVYS